MSDDNRIAHLRGPNFRVTLAQPTPPSDASYDVRRLQAQARAVGRASTLDLADRLNEAADLAAQIASMGDAVPVGCREIARQLADALPANAANISRLLSRG